MSDTIYSGANVPLGEIGDAQMSSTQPQVTLYNLNGGGLPQVEFSLGWQADDAFGTFSKWWGNGERVNDAAAWGGTAYRLYPGNDESFAWVYDTTFIKDILMVAYFRLKANANTSTAEVARISVKGGGTEYGPISLRGTDIAASNQYQEFPVSFTFNTNPDDAFLIFQIWQSGAADVYFDAVSIFTATRAVASPLTWSVPGGNYRGQGVQVRYTNGSQFSAIGEGGTTQGALRLAPPSLTFLAARDGLAPPAATLTVAQDCASFNWQASSNAPWLQVQPGSGFVRVSVNQAGLTSGVYTGTVTVSPVGAPGIAPASTSVQLIVADHIAQDFLPVIRR